MRKLSERSGGNRSGGFTLLETLLAVAILVILLGLSTVGVARYRDHLKIAELDNAARDIYMAAENRAVLLQNSGQLGTPSATLLSGSGVDELTSLNVGGKAARMLSSENTNHSGKLEELVPLGSIDPSLRYFRVIYDEATGHVVETFYAEGEIDDTKLDKFRESRSDRVSEFRSKNTERLVGHYQSTAADEIGTHPLPTPGVEVIIENGNELTLTVRYTMPALPSGVTVNSAPKVTLEYKNPENPTEVYTVDLWDNPRRKPSGDITFDPSTKTASYTWVLDSLDTSKQFKGLVSGADLGADFTVTAGIKLSADGYIDSAYYATGTDNSLFANGSTYNTTDGTAKIANLRHLQNLCLAGDGFTSNVGGGIKNAQQLVDIYCDTYLTNTAYEFVPIVNDNLTSYNGKNGGKNTHIYSLTTKETDNAGLFGKVSHNLTIDDCRVCWNAPAKLVNDGDYVYAVRGTNAGGLIGSVADSGDVTIENSFAATAVSGTNAAGGLVGSVSVSAGGKLDILNSYADCYLTGGNAGGLVGSGSANKLENCYAAGFITGGSNTAGLVNGGLASVSCAYSVVRVIGEDGKLEAPASRLYNGTNEIDGVRYLSKAADAAESIFGYIAKPETHAYDLRYERDNSVESLKDKTYPYSGVKDMGDTLLPHYGDWADLEDETLIPLPEADIKITVVNSEELTLTVEYTLPKLPEGLAYSEVTRTPSVVVNYQYTDAGGNDKTAMAELPFTGAGRTPTTTSDKTIDAAGTGETVSYTWVLDSLEKGVFKDLGFKDESGALIDLAFGGDFTVSASLKLTTGKEGYESSNKGEAFKSATENSLFSKDTTSDTACVANLRHLQNLDSVHSGAGGKSAAVQTVKTLRETECVRMFANDGMGEYTDKTETKEEEFSESKVIDAGKAKDNDGVTLNENYEFKPITNWELFSYDGKKMTIEKLKVTVDSAAGKNSAGLFGVTTYQAADPANSVEEKIFQFKDIRIVDANVTGNTNGAGALLGYSWNPTKFDNCHLVNTTVTGTTSTTVPDTSVVAGGMMGQTWSAAITFNNCTASGLTVTSATEAALANYAGGLMGWQGMGTVSFTDCKVGEDGSKIEISGTQAGGLLGNAGNTGSPVTATFTNCVVGQPGSAQAEKKVSILGAYYTGGLVGNISGGTFTKCNVYNARVGSPNKATSESGGLVGRATSASFQECAAQYLAVEGNTNAGGLLGGAIDISMGNEKMCKAEDVTVAANGYAGGVAGNVTRGMFTDCHAVNTKVEAANLAAGGLMGVIQYNYVLHNDDGTSTDASIPDSAVNKVTKLDGCRVYWEGSGLSNLKSGGLQYQVTAETAGGLVGIIRNGVNIQNSFAATFVSGTVYAGGLLGELATPEAGGYMGVTVQISYADCYLQAGPGKTLDGNNYIPYASGLVGMKGPDYVLTLNNVYAAGFIDLKPHSAGGQVAGLSGGWVADTSKLVITNAYAAVHYNASAAGYPLACGYESADYEKKYYFLESNWGWSTDYDTMRSISLGNAFEYDANTPETHRYDLSTNAGTGTYPFPGLKGLPHYGDWLKN